MYYYEVWVSSQRFHGDKPLTYSSENELTIGTVIRVSLNKRIALGIVAQKAKKPDFNTQPALKQVADRPLPSETRQLMEWLGTYYPGPSGLLTQLFLPTGLLQTANKQREQILKHAGKFSLPPLTDDQAQALNAIAKTDKTKPVLLHGETGTGKTRIYLELAKQEFKQGRSVLILTPEIGLTPQLIKSFESIFPGKVISTHSNLTPAQRRYSWLKILEAIEPQIIIGPRSALFSPISNLGLIVVDEAHDGAYKQDQVPHYQATRVAAHLGRLHKARVVLGSATPAVVDFATFEAKKLPIVRMSEPAVKLAQAKSISKVIDLSDKSLFTRSKWLSDELLKGLEKNINGDEQALLFLNRRGTARIILCQDCGWQLLCPRCDLPLTYHGDSHSARCHTCGYSASGPTECPKCHSTEIVFKSIGTKLIASEVQRLFPQARVKRFDSDNLKSEKLEAHYDAVQDGEVDILVGTQVLSKGLDLPRLSLVGIIVADTGLYIPDYTADENTYQMLSQVAGRVGRGHRSGMVIIQTYHPDSLVTRAALDKDYHAFYETQIKERGQFVFPPFCYLLKLTCTRASRASAESTCEKLAITLGEKSLPISVVGPAPAFHEKQGSKYTWQLVVKAKQRQLLLDIIKDLPSNWFYDIDPTNLL